MVSVNGRKLLQLATIKGGVIVMVHLHITVWLLAIILLFIVIGLQNSGKEKGAKILQMILRLDYLVILYSGGSMFADLWKWDTVNNGEVFVKVLAGLWVIITIEMIGIRNGKNKSTKGLWIQFIIAFLITLILGFGRLPLGVQLFG